MNAKRVITAALLAFVAAALVVMVVQNRRHESAANTAGAYEPTAAAEGAHGTTYAVYYFHATQRCNTCLTLERYSKNTMEEAFADDLASGRVTWQVINYELPENQHFAKDYDISYQTLMVLELKDGEPVRWKKLEGIWDEVGSEFSFYEYVQSEIHNFMNEA